jgi:hypothetical protein
VVRHPAADSPLNKENWVHGRSGVTWTVSLPENPGVQPPFSVRLSGFLTVEREGLYTFYLKCDSGSSVTIDNLVVVGDSSATFQDWREGRAEVEKGKHPFSVIGLVTNEPYALGLEYEGPGFEKKPIPPRLLTTK